MGKQRYQQKIWNAIKAGGDAAPTWEFVEQIFDQKEEEAMISRDELKRRIVNYFRSITAVIIDDDGNERTIWTTNPTKSSFALAINIDKDTIARYIKGSFNGKSYNDRPGPRQIVATEDFDLLRKAHLIIESFYEGRLGSNGNPAGSIFWLLNLKADWSNENTVTVRQVEERKQLMSLEDLPALPALGEAADIDPRDLPEYD